MMEINLNRKNLITNNIVNTNNQFHYNKDKIELKIFPMHNGSF